MGAMDVGILPVKRLTAAKARLAPHLDPAQRVSLARALLDDALELCLSVPELTWYALSDDPRVLERARDRGLRTLRDDGHGLNPALAQAVRAVMSEGALSITVIPIDVPLARRADLDDLLDTAATSDVVLVPSSRDNGTNALYLRPPDRIEPRFGRASLKAHLAEAERKALRCSILSLPRLGLDLDTIEDLETIGKRLSAGSHTGALIHKLLAAQSRA